MKDTRSLVECCSNSGDGEWGLLWCTSFFAIEMKNQFGWSLSRRFGSLLDNNNNNNSDMQLKTDDCRATTDGLKWLFFLLELIQLSKWSTDFPLLYCVNTGSRIFVLRDCLLERSRLCICSVEYVKWMCGICKKIVWSYILLYVLRNEETFFVLSSSSFRCVFVWLCQSQSVLHTG